MSESTDNFQSVYVMMYERLDGDLQIAKNGSSRGNKIVIAIEGNQHCLNQIGDGLLADDLILGYQILKTVAAPIRKFPTEEVVAAKLDEIAASVVVGRQD